MNISMLVLNNFTNDARVQKEATTLASAGYNVLVIALWQQGLARSEQQSGYQIIRLRLHSRSSKNRLLSPLIKYLEFAWQIWRLSGHNPAQIYHANDANTLPAAWLASKHNHAKLVYDAHELETGRNFSGGSINGIYRTIWTFPEKIFINKVQSVITVSPSIANMLEHQYHVPLPHVILNCPELKKTSISNRLRQELNIPENYKILLYQGRVAIGRGIEPFLNAVQQVEDAVGVVLGDGPALEALRDRLRSGEWERVYLPGPVPLSDLPSYTISGDVGMVLIQDTCLSYRLSLPNKLFEYLHAGLPVIGSNLPEIARVIREYQVGELTDPEKPTSIAQSIQSILSDPIRLAQLKANTSIAAEDFNWQNESKKLLKVYSTLDHG